VFFTLPAHTLANGTEIVAQMKIAGGLDAGENQLSVFGHDNSPESTKALSDKNGQRTTENSPYTTPSFCPFFWIAAIALLSRNQDRSEIASHITKTIA